MFRSSPIRRPFIRLLNNTRYYAIPPSPNRNVEKDPQLGDYPQLPDISRQHLPPTGWWDNQMRTNFGDTLHEKEEIYSMWGPDIPSIPPRQALVDLSIAVCFFIAFGFGAYAFTPEREAIPRQFPYNGLIRELGGLEENKANPLPEEEEEE